jgi:hypothetical protein
LFYLLNGGKVARYQLNVFDAKTNKIGSLVIMIGRTAVPSNQDPFLWQWQGKGGAAFGQWEWRYSGGEYRIVLFKLLNQNTWGTLTGDWKTLPTIQSFPQQPWFSTNGVKEGDISVNTPSNYYTGTWKLL